jgi:hypothetical protein
MVLYLVIFLQLIQVHIEGYIPEKPAKTPDWLYDLIKLCIGNPRFQRPLFNDILQFLKTEG